MSDFIKKDILFWAGMNTKIDDKSLGTSEFREIQNAEFSFPVGALSKRDGFTELNSNGASSSIGRELIGLGSRNQELVGFKRDNLYSFSPARNNFFSQSYSPSSVLEFDFDEITRNNYDQKNFDCDYIFSPSGSFACYAYEDTRGGIRFSIKDISPNGGGAFLVADREVCSSGSRPRVIANTNNNITGSRPTFYIWYSFSGSVSSSNSHNLGWRNFDPFTGTALSNFNAIAGARELNVSGTYLYDVCRSADGNGFFLGMVNPTMPSFIGSWKINTSGTAHTGPNLINSQVLSGGSSGPNFLRIFDTFYSGTSRETNLLTNNFGEGQNYRLNPDTAARREVSSTFFSVAQIIKNLTQVIEENGDIVIFADFRLTNNYQASVFKQVIQTGTNTPLYSTSGIFIPFFNSGLAGDAFRYEKQNYIPLIYQGTTASYGTEVQSTLFLGVDKPNPITSSAGSNATASLSPIAGKAFYGNAGQLLTSTYSRMPKSVLSGSTAYSLANKKGAFENELTTAKAFTNFGMAETRWGLKNKPPYVVVNDVLYYGGGYLSSYDGANAYEASFHLAPEAYSSSVVGGTLSDIPSGSYNYKMIYEFLDNQGNTFWSSPNFEPIIPNMAGNSYGINTITAFPITFTNKPSGSINLLLYRTTINSSGPYYQVGTRKAIGANETITFTDISPDSTILSNNPLYIGNGQFENAGVGATHALVNHRNRMFAVASDEVSSIWFSKPITERNTVWWGQQKIKVPEEGGRITALASYNDNLVIFKKNHIFALDGEGPNADGSGKPYVLPEKISETDGCSQRDSVVVIPQGVIFANQKGIQLLSNGTPQFIGAPVEAYTLSGSISSVSHIIDKQQVRFTLSGTTELPMLTYDYYAGKWSIFTNLGSRDGLVINNPTGSQHVILTNNGQSVARQHQGLFQDVFSGSTNYPLRIETGWMDLQGIDGFFKIKDFAFLGEFRSACTLRVRVYANYNETTPIDTKSITLSSVSIDGNVLFRRQLSVRKMTAIKFIIDDLTLATGEVGAPGAAFDMTGISLGVLINNKLFRTINSG